MPPKSDLSLLTERDQVFLVECIKNSKEKLVPDFDLVAQATSMSKKGAANKFRDFMKRFDAAAGITSGENGAATKKPAAKRANPATTKKGAAATEAGGQDGEDESEEDEPPKKKANTTKTRAKAPAKPKVGVKKGVAKKKAATTKSEEKVEEDSDDEAGEDGESQNGEVEMKDEEDESV